MEPWDPLASLSPALGGVDLAFSGCWDTEGNSSSSMDNGVADLFSSDEISELLFESIMVVQIRMSPTTLVLNPECMKRLILEATIGGLHLRDLQLTCAALGIVTYIKPIISSS